MSDLEEQMNKLFGSNRANYSVEDIEEAKKRQKRYGGTLYDNLSEITAARTGKKPLAPIMGSGEVASANGILEQSAKNLSMAQADIERLQSAVKTNASDINTTLGELNKNLRTDFTIEKTGSQAVVKEGSAALENFSGLQDALKEKVFGQDEFIKKLTIAFKRPFVSERDHNDALNSIFISGPECTGRHYALELIAGELNTRNVLTSSEVYRMDLSRYPTTAEEKLFIQDLYSALRSKAAVILFENFANCNVAMLSRLSDLVSTGESMLSERYVMQNGQLVGVTNALAGETVGSLEAPGKYLVFLGTESVGKLADIMGAPFVNALGDICITRSLDDEAVKKVAARHEEQLKARVSKQLDYELSIDDSYRDHAVSCTSKGRGLKGVIDAYEDALKALSEFKLERDDYTGSSIGIAYDEDGAGIIAGEERLPMNDYIQESYSGELEAVDLILCRPY